MALYNFNGRCATFSMLFISIISLLCSCQLGCGHFRNNVYSPRTVSPQMITHTPTSSPMMLSQPRIPCIYSRSGDFYKRKHLHMLDKKNEQQRSYCSKNYNKKDDSIIPRHMSSSISIESNNDYTQQNNIKLKNFLNGLKKAALSNWLVIGEVIVILFAKAFPKIGCTGGPLRPEFYVSKLGVFLIFFINGISITLKQQDDAKARTIGKTNLLIQLYNIGFIPIVALLLAPFYPNEAFRDGIRVLSVIPTTINICVAQTLAAGGDMPLVIFNAIFANLLGVFLTPILTIFILGATGGSIDLLATFRKLWMIVVLPMILGQLARKTPLVTIAEKFYKPSRTLSSLLLLAIVYTTFSDTFISGLGVGGWDLFGLLFSMPLAYVLFSGFFWIIMEKVVPGLDAKGKAAALLCSSQKTLAFGIPFIKTALGTRPDLANVLAPLLLYAPAQLIIASSFFVPFLQKKIREQDIYEMGGGI